MTELTVNECLLSLIDLVMLSETEKDQYDHGDQVEHEFRNVCLARCGSLRILLAKFLRIMVCMKTKFQWVTDRKICGENFRQNASNSLFWALPITECCSYF